ncbi:hypothetical protein GCM10027084_12650 [Pseudoxanthomonas sangjuensis]
MKRVASPSSRIAAFLFCATLAALASGCAALPKARGGDAPNSKPFVVPALQEWSGRHGRAQLGPASRIVLDAADAGALRGVAEQLQADLRDLCGWRVAVHSGAPAAGDIVLDLDAALAVGPDTALTRDEGYVLEVSDKATISARTPKAVFWGTRSLLQMLAAQAGADGKLVRGALPAGTAADWPNYRTRGFLLDVGRQWFGEQFVLDYVRHMSWFKLNTFQLHLNDNQIKAPGGDWSKAYAAFRLASDNPAFAGLAAADGAYTRTEWDELEQVAANHFVTIVPEIDAPAHARAFIAFKPGLGLDGGNSDHLDLSKPATTTFMASVYDEFVPWFRGPVVHMGADEYPKELAADYRNYFNRMAAHIRELGKQPAAWGSFVWMSGTSAGYDKDVLIEAFSKDWFPGSQSLREGYHTINAIDSWLYLVPMANYYHGRGLEGEKLFNEWEPHVFGNGDDMPARHPLLDGAISSLWNDCAAPFGLDCSAPGNGYGWREVHRLLEPTLGLLAQKMWRGVESGQTYAEFMAGVARLGVGPGAGLIEARSAD